MYCIFVDPVCLTYLVNPKEKVLALTGLKHDMSTTYAKQSGFTPWSLRPNSASWMGFPPLGCLVVYMTSCLHVMQRSASLLHCLSGLPHQRELSNHVLVMVSFCRGLWFPWLLLILWHGFIHGEYSCQPHQCNLLLLLDVWSQRSSLYLNRAGRWSVHSWFWSSTVETSSNVNNLQLQQELSLYVCTDNCAATVGLWFSFLVTWIKVNSGLIMKAFRNMSRFEGRQELWM